MQQKSTIWSVGLFVKINDGELSYGRVYACVASSESSKVAGSSLMGLIFLGCVGPSSACASSSWPVPTENSCHRRRSGTHKPSLSLFQSRNQTLEVLVSTLLNCSCWTTWLPWLLPALFTRISEKLCSAIPILSGMPCYLLSFSTENRLLFFPSSGVLLPSPAGIQRLPQQYFCCHLTRKEELLPPFFLPLLPSLPLFTLSHALWTLTLPCNTTNHFGKNERPFPSSP